ncbi:MAG: ABC transporter ATP-binding protein [Candidatus Rokubacteria bacterium]|nr:ABC transporter ATP-binding protein [Candidatus Rokubacteria bacterium]
MPALLEGAEVSKNFGGLRVLRKVSFGVAEGEIVALIGPNGAGKTTLFNLITGLVRPSEGSIRMAGRPITALPPHRICRLGLARTFQTPRPFLDLTAAANVRTAALFSGRPGARQPEELLALVELGSKAGALARHLPAGSRKLLELAMALALNPRVVLLDEILAGLTAPEIGRVTAILRRIRDQWGIALFWIEHVIRAVMETAERVIVLHHGEVICEGDPRSVSADARVLHAYLGEPTTS